MVRIKDFKTKQGHSLDSSLVLPPNPKALVIFFPCGFGNIHAPFYQTPEESLLKQGIGVFRYNPRSHGKSGGTWTVKNAVEDLVFCLAPHLKQRSTELPLFGLGHSIGGANLLLVAEQFLKFDKLILAAPVLNSRESLLYKYENLTTGDFANLYMTGDNEKDRFVQQMMKTSDWINLETWNKANLSKKLDYPVRNDRGVCLDSLSEFLFSCFIEGLDAYKALAQVAKICSVYYPQTDSWVSPTKTQQTCRSLGIVENQLIDTSGHFLVKSWALLWNKMLDLIDKRKPQTVDNLKK